MGDTSVEKINKFFDGIQTFMECDSRNIGKEAGINSDPSIKARYFEIPTPAWFPDSFLRSLKRNNYLKMVNAASVLGTKNSISAANDGSSLDFYKESNSNMITGLVNNAAKSILSTAANQIVSVTSKVDSLISGFKNAFGSSTDAALDAAISENASEPFLSTQPYMTIYGIHMTEKLRDTMSAFSSAIGIAISAINSNTMNAVMSSIRKGDIEDAWETLTESAAKKIEEKAVKILNKFMPDSTGGDIYEIITQMFKDENLRLHGLGEVILNSTISGTYTMKCKVPYFSSNDNSPIISSYGEEGFTPLGHMNVNAKKINEKVRDFSGLNIAWSNPVEWSLGEVKNYTPANIQFDIFNDTIEHVLTNLFFIWSFGATSKAVTDTLFIRPPFLYNIEIPGGFRYRYCKCRFKVHARGKLRKISSFKGSNDAMPTLFENIFGYKVNPNALNYIPDYYTVNMQFGSILPDLWNYMDTYLKDADRDKVEIGNRVQTLMAKLLSAWNEA